MTSSGTGEGGGMGVLTNLLGGLGVGADSGSDTSSSYLSGDDRKVPAYRIATATRPNDPTGEPLAGGLSEHSFGVTNATLAAKPAPTARTASDVKLDVQRMSSTQLDELARKLIAAGLLDDSEAHSRAKIESAWSDLVDKSASYREANPDSLLTPEDMIDLYGNKGVDGQAGKTVTQVNNLRLADADQARVVLEKMLSSALGRAPTGKEADDFQAALNSAQSKSPEVTTYSTSKDAAGNTVTTSTPTGGLDVDAFKAKYEREHVQNTDEYRHYQAATTYYQAMMQAIRGPMG